jgi:hypothetical protein
MACSVSRCRAETTASAHAFVHNFLLRNVTVLHLYFDLFACFWHDVAESLEERTSHVQWVVQFGDVEKPLDQISPQTGLPGLISPVQRRFAHALSDNIYDGLTVIFRLDPSRGLTHALRGPRSVVARAQAALRSAAAQAEDDKDSGTR